MSGRKTRHLYNNICQLPGRAAITVPTTLTPSSSTDSSESHTAVPARATVRARRSHYLEIGSYTGSTCVSAAYKTNVRVTCVDNFSEFKEDKARDTMFANIEAGLPVTAELTVRHAWLLGPLYYK
jgi:hypothetical protein